MENYYLKNQKPLSKSKSNFFVWKYILTFLLLNTYVQKKFGNIQEIN